MDDKISVSRSSQLKLPIWKQENFTDHCSVIICTHKRHVPQLAQLAFSALFVIPPPLHVEMQPALWQL